MWEATTGLPEQIVAALEWEGAEVLALSAPITNVVVAGMGGSGIVGDLVSAVAAGEMSVPVTVSKSYDLPAFCGPDTLVVAVSFSGNTAETLEVAERAAAVGASAVAITSGGSLGTLARREGWPLAPVPGEIPQP